MLRIFISSILLILCFNLPGQGTKTTRSLRNPEKNVENIQDSVRKEVVYTPLGPAFRDNVHKVGTGRHLMFKNGVIEMIQTKTGTLENISDSKKEKSDSKYFVKSKDHGIFSELNSQNGWITNAACQIYIPEPKPTYFSTDWIVPSPPLINSNQIIYIFNGLGGGKILDDGNSIAYILQPVLQWGKTPAGGGQYWAICNWFVTNKGQFYYDTLMEVKSGDKLQGVIKLISGTDTSYNYNSSFAGYSTGLDVYNLPNLGTAYFALEAYNIKRCDEYPADEKIRMYNIQIVTDSVYPPVIWYTSNTIDNCGQFTNIIDESPDNGEVNIHFRKPFSPDGFEDIYTYPNPVTDNVHFSITNPLYNCRIEIFNNLGNLISTEFHKTLEYGYDLNFQNYGPGLYLIKFYFQKDLITREDSHIFKIIKI